MPTNVPHSPLARRALSRQRPLLPPRALHPAALPLPLTALSAVARRLGRRAEPWARRAGEPLTARRFEVLVATESFEAWMIDWPPGTALDLHDHGASAAAFFVVSGTLDEITVAAGAMARRRLRRGGTATVAPCQVHAVVNRGPRPATSVHVYSPRLTAMTYYAPGRKGSLEATRREQLDAAERSSVVR
jgi:mannose-6-phosphate isomerase-like protein (cupin superfamily)